MTEKTNQLQPEYGHHLRTALREKKVQARAGRGGATNEDHKNCNFGK